MIPIIITGLNKLTLLHQTMKLFPYHNIHKQKHTDHILWCSSTFAVQCFRGDDCQCDHCLVAARIKEWLSVSKQSTQHSDMERFDRKKPEGR